MRHLWYRPDGTPCSIEEANQYLSGKAKIVAKTELKLNDEKIEVSTVFLGLDHRFGDEGLPVLWETMIFGGPDELDNATDRYTSRDAAAKGHGDVVSAFLKHGATVVDHKVTPTEEKE